MLQDGGCAVAQAVIHVAVAPRPDRIVLLAVVGLNLLECYYGVVKFDALFMTKTS